MNLAEIRTVAARGLIGLAEALAGAGANERLRPLLRSTWGPRPVLTLGLVAVAAGLGGVMLDGLVPRLWFRLGAIGPVLLFSAVAAWRIRRVLRRSQAEVLETAAQSFRALTVPLVPAVAVLVLVTTLAPHLLPPDVPGAAATAFGSDSDGLGIAVRVLLGWLAQGAGLAVCVATLVGRRSWPGSLIEIGWRYLVFRLLLAGSFFALGIMSNVVLGLLKQLLSALVSWRLPESWLAILDRLIDGGFAALVFLALIGGAWTAAEQCFPRLLRTGDVHFLRAMAGLFSEQKKPPRETADPSWSGVSEGAVPTGPPPPPAD